MDINEHGDHVLFVSSWNPRENIEHAFMCVDKIACESSLNKNANTVN